MITDWESQTTWEPKLQPAYPSCEAVLLCPACGDNYLHQQRVDVFERAEDREECLHVAVDSVGARIDRSCAGNPSCRRHGTTVVFWCEGCGGKSRLSIAQHKGHTLVEMRPVE